MVVFFIRKIRINKGNMEVKKVGDMLWIQNNYEVLMVFDSLWFSLA